MKKRILILALLICLVVSCFAACGGNNEPESITPNQSFTAKSEKIVTVKKPASLPEKVADFKNWDDTAEEWVMISQTEDGKAQFFAQSKEEDKIFLKISDKFFALNLENVRKERHDVKLLDVDIDKDGINEIVAITSVPLGTTFNRENLYIIKSDSVIEFPLTEIEKYINDNLILNGTVLQLDKLKVDIPKEKLSDTAKIADELTNVTFSFEGGFVMTAEAAIQSDAIVQVANIKCDMSFKDGKFTIDKAIMEPVKL